MGYSEDICSSPLFLSEGIGLSVSCSTWEGGWERRQHMPAKRITRACTCSCSVAESELLQSYKVSVTEALPQMLGLKFPHESMYQWKLKWAEGLDTFKSIFTVLVVEKKKNESLFSCPAFVCKLGMDFSLQAVFSGPLSWWGLLVFITCIFNSCLPALVHIGLEWIVVSCKVKNCKAQGKDYKLD